jgi:hypothetical protein
LQKKGLILLQGLLQLFLSFGWNEAECSIHDQKFSPQLLKADIIVVRLFYYKDFYFGTLNYK